MQLEVASGEFVETQDKRVSVTVEDNASNRTRVWLKADAARDFAWEILAAVEEIMPDHSALSREECIQSGRKECSRHGVWIIG